MRRFPMYCPKCGLTNPDTAQRCDCGYDFDQKKILEPYPKKLRKKPVQSWIIIVMVAAYFSLLGYGIYRGKHRSQAELQMEAQQRAEARERDRLALEREKEMEKEREHQIISSVELAIMSWIPESQPMIRTNGSTLKVYIKKSEFQSIPFPDQPKLATEVSNVWCRYHNSLFASVTISDISTGAEFGSKRCGLSR
jgi:hypothetical protein